MVVIGIVRAGFEAKQKGWRATRNRIHPEGLDGDSGRIEPALDERLPLDLWCLHEPNESVRIHSPLYERHWHLGFKPLVTPRRQTSHLLSRVRTRRGSHTRVVTSQSVEVVISTSVARRQESMAESPGGRRRTGRRAMRKLVVAEYVTLDGVMQDPGGVGEFPLGGWSNKYFNDELGV